MQTTQGIGVHTKQLHKHKHVLTFTAMIEVKALNLENWNEPISQEQAERMCAGLNS